MDKYFNLFREMISLRGLSDHTLSSYCTYIRSYLDYLERILKRILRMSHGLNYGILSDGSRTTVTFLTALLILRLHSSVSSRSTSFTNPGWIPSFQSAGLIPIFLLSLPRKIPGSLSPRFRTFASKRLFPSCILPVCVPVKSGILSILI